MADLGHNIGTGLDALKAQAEAYVERAGRIAEVTAETAGLVRDLQAEGTKLGKEIEAERRNQKKPHEDAAKAVDTAFKPVLDQVSKAIDQVRAALTKFLMEEERRRKEEEARARRAAEEAARKAAEAAKEADPFDQFDASAEKERALRAAEEAAKLAASRVRVGSVETGAKAATLRTAYLVEVIDGPALVRHFAASPTMIEEARKIAAAQVRAAKGDACGIPGIRVIEDRKAV